MEIAARQAPQPQSISAGSLSLFCATLWQCLQTAAHQHAQLLSPSASLGDTAEAQPGLADKHCMCCFDKCYYCVTQCSMQSRLHAIRQCQPTLRQNTAFSAFPFILHPCRHVANMYGVAEKERHCCCCCYILSSVVQDVPAQREAHKLAHMPLQAVAAVCPTSMSCSKAFV